MGLQIVFQPVSLLAVAGGVFAGIVGGAIPGINASMTMALLLPLTWGMDPAVALMMLVGVYCGGQYGGSISAVLIGTPGTSSAAATVLDGYPMHKKGQTGKALGMSLIASFVGGLIASICLFMMVVPLAKVALSFGPAEYFGLAVLGLTLIASLASGNVIKGLMAGAFGLLLSTIGLDPFAGVGRFTFGRPELIGGLGLIPVMIGLFAGGELLTQIRYGVQLQRITEKVATAMPTWAELRSVVPFMLMGGVIGVFVGAMPGAGASIACWIGYNEAKRWSKRSHLFGTGILEGIAAPEAANNGTTGGAMVPLLALGIPGSNSTAVMLGALLIHGISPGPLLFRDMPKIPYSVFGAIFVANFFMLLMGFLFIRLCVRITNIRHPLLVASIFSLIFVGAYSINNNVFDVGVIIGFGFLGFLMRRYNFPTSATVLGLVLGFIVEANLRRALTLSGGSPSFLVQRPITFVLMIATVASLVVSLYREFQTSRKRLKAAAGSAG